MRWGVMLVMLALVGCGGAASGTPPVRPILQTLGAVTVADWLAYTDGQRVELATTAMAKMHSCTTMPESVATYMTTIYRSPQFRNPPAPVNLMGRVLTDRGCVV